MTTKEDFDKAVWMMEAEYGTVAEGSKRIAAQCMEVIKAHLVAKDREIEEQKLEIADWRERLGELCDMAWSYVYKGKTDWEYPTQAIRHLRQYCDELKAELSSLKQRIEGSPKVWILRLENGEYRADSRPDVFRPEISGGIVDECYAVPVEEKEA